MNRGNIESDLIFDYYAEQEAERREAREKRLDELLDAECEYESYLNSPFDYEDHDWYDEQEAEEYDDWLETAQRAEEDYWYYREYYHDLEPDYPLPAPFKDDTASHYSKLWNEVGY